MNKILAILLSILMTVSCFSMLLTFGAGAISTNLLNNGDFETPTSVSGVGEPLGQYIPGAPTNAQSTGFNSWFRATGGTTAYHDSIQVDPDNSNNHIGKIAQTLYQGVTLQNGKSYTLSFRAKADVVTGTTQDQYMTVMFYNATTSVVGGTPEMGMKTDSISGTIKDASGSLADRNVNVIGTNPYKYTMLHLYNDGWYEYKINFTVADNGIASGTSYGIRFQSSSNYSSSWFYMYIDNIVLSEPNSTTSTISAKVSATDQGGSVSVNGGTSGQNVSAQVITGDPVTLVATPFVGNTFKGWYDSTGSTLISANATYVTTCAGAVTYIAKFVSSSSNLFNNPGFEGYDADTYLSKGAGVLSQDGWSSGVTSWACNVVRSSQTAPAYPVYSGSKSLEIYCRNNSGTSYTFTVVPNTDYKINLKWLLPADKSITGGTLGYKISYIKVTDAAGTTFTGAIKSQVLGTGNWEDLTLNFNSGSNTTALLCFQANYDSSQHADQLFVDDILITTTSATTNTVSATVSATDSGGSVSVNGGTSGQSASAQVVTGGPITLVATPFTGITFKGWYDSTGSTLISPNATYTTTCTGNVSYVAKFINTSGNLFNNPGFEGYNADTYLSKGAGVLSQDGWSSGVTSWAYNVVRSSQSTPAYPVYSGTKSLEIWCRNNSGTSYTFTVIPNTDYKINLKWLLPADKSIVGGTLGYKISYIKVTDAAGTTFTGASKSQVLGTGNWEDLTLNFNSGSNTTALLCFQANYDSTQHADQLFVDDILITKATTTPTAPTTPTVSTNGYVSETWSKNDVSFTISGSTYTTDIAKYQYSTDGATWNDITDSNGTITKNGNNVTQVVFPVTASGSYSFKAIANDGTTSGATASTSVKIDKTTPAVGVDSGSYTAGSWTKNDVTITLSNTATNASGVSYKYSTNGATWTAITGTTLVVSTDTNASYQFKAVSGAGIESTASSVISIKVQKTLPANATVVLNPTSPDAGLFYKTAPTIAITAPTITTTAPVTTYYKLWAGTIEPTDGITFTGTNPVITVDGNYTLKIWTVDAAGNASAFLTKTILVDANASSVLPGDINGDKIGDLKDVTLLSRSVAGWTGLTIIGNPDVNNDGVADLKDVTLLSRFVAGWSVTIH